MNNLVQLLFCPVGDSGEILSEQQVGRAAMLSEKRGPEAAGDAEASPGISRAGTKAQAAQSRGQGPSRQITTDSNSNTGLESQDQL